MTLNRSAAPRPVSAAPSERRTGQLPRWRWPLRVIAPLMTAMLWSQPLLIGLFLGGEFSRLQAHAALGGVITAVTMLQFLAAVPAWRPGGLPGWVVAVTAAMVAGAVVQIVAGYQRNLGLHVPLGVGLAAAGLGVAVRAWLPVRPRRDHSAKSADLPVTGPPR